MAENTFTSLFPSLYAGLNIVSRELTGFIPSVTINADGVQRAKLDQTIYVPIAPVANVEDITPAMTVPDPTGQTSTTAEISISSSRTAEFGFVGEDVLGLDTGPGYNVLQANMFAEAVRAITNEVETDIAELYSTTSRAYGTAGTTPFASDLGPSAQIRKILDDNGAPGGGRSCIIDTAAGASLRTLGQLTKANEVGDAMTVRTGELINLHNISWKESGQIQTHTKGTGTSYVTNGGFAVGETEIDIDTGSGTVVAGDVITFAGDTNKYVVATALAAGTVTIAEPGLKKAVLTGVAMSIGANYSANFGFSQNAIQLVGRAPALPEGGDVAAERTMIVDPFSGLPLEVSLYRGYRKVRFEVALAWGVANIKPEHTVTLLG